MFNLLFCWVMLIQTHKQMISQLEVGALKVDGTEQNIVLLSCTTGRTDQISGMPTLTKILVSSRKVLHG